MDILNQLFSDYTLRVVALGSATLGIVSGSLGTFAVLRGQSLLGDAISHAALPGIALAYLLTGSKAPLVLMLGAAVAGWLATLAIMTVTEMTRIKYDSMLGLTLSVFFGIGLVLLTYIQHTGAAGQAGLDTFLFGQAAALIRSDVITMAALGGTALLLLVVFWKEIKLLSFDPEFGRSLGFPIRAVDILLTTMLVVAIVIGLQTVGVVLMSAMLIAPAAAGRQWTDRLGVMVVLSAAFGAAAGVGGALISSTTRGLPTGPTIVLVMGAIVLTSVLLAPNRGIIWRAVRARRGAGRIEIETALHDLHAMAAQHGDPRHPHEVGALDVTFGRKSGQILRRLESLGYVYRADANRWALTDEGVRHAEELRAAS